MNIEIHDDRVYIDGKHRSYSIPEPTLAFFRLYKERRGYFDDEAHGLGRLLAALKRQLEPGYIRALRAGKNIPNEEAQEEAEGTYAAEFAECHYAILYVAAWANKINEEKAKKLLQLRMKLDDKALEGMLELADARPV